MAKQKGNQLTQQQTEKILQTLQTRFEKNKSRHTALEWSKVQKKLEANPDKLWSLHRMEETGGEPDVVDFDKETGEACVTTMRLWKQEKNTSQKTVP